MREMFEPPAFFETLGVRYTGPFDGHDIEGLEKALRQRRRVRRADRRPRAHQKGRGYAPAEDDDEAASTTPACSTSALGPQRRAGSYTAAFTEAMIKEAEARPELVAITAAMPDSTGLLPFEERFPDRFIDVGIAEQHAVTSAAGMAMGGLRPVVAIYSTFLTRAIDQVNLDVGLHGQPVVFCLDRAGITGDDGAVAPRRARHGRCCHEGPGHDDVRPVVVPGAAGACSTTPSTSATGPAAIRWPKTARRRSVGEDEVGSGLPARKVRDGRDVCILAVGKMLAAAEDAADVLAAEGIEATVWDARVVKPLDPEMIADAAPLPARGHRRGRHPRRRRRLAARRRHRRAGRPSAAPNPVVRVLGVPDALIPHGKPDEILADLGLDAAGIAAEARRLLGR